MEINQLMSATNLLTVTSLMLNVTDQSDPFLEERLLWFMWCFKTIKLKRISVWFPAPLIELLIRSKMDFLVQRTTAPSKLRAAGSILGQRERDEEAGEGKKNQTNSWLILIDYQVYNQRFVLDVYRLDTCGVTSHSHRLSLKTLICGFFI